MTHLKLEKIDKFGIFHGGSSTSSERWRMCKIELYSLHQLEKHCLIVRAILSYFQLFETSVCI